MHASVLHVVYVVRLVVFVRASVCACSVIFNFYSVLKSIQSLIAVVVTPFSTFQWFCVCVTVCVCLCVCFVCDMCCVFVLCVCAVCLCCVFVLCLCCVCAVCACACVILGAKTTTPSPTEMFVFYGHPFKGYFVCGCMYMCVWLCVWLFFVCLSTCFVYFELHTSGCPTLVRSDCGTENVSIATCQMAARHEHDDQFAGGNSFIFGSSIRNTVSMMCIVTSILSHGSSCSELRAGCQSWEALEVTGGLIYLKCVLRCTYDFVLCLHVRHLLQDCTIQMYHCFDMFLLFLTKI